MNELPKKPRVAIIGGGLAGLASAVALAERDCSIELFESRRKLGGRAGSFTDSASGESIDHCQHVAMGCCTNFLDFCRRTGIDDLLQRHQTLHFFGPDGRRSDFRPSGWLPAPLHLAGPLFSLKFLSLTDKISIARAMLRLVRMQQCAAADAPTVMTWLRQQGQNETVIQRFWQVVLVSALGESLDRASMLAARKVFLDGFLRHRTSSHALVPKVSLAELYDDRVATWLRSQGVQIHLQSSIEALLGNAGQIRGIQVASGQCEFDFVILAIPWRRVAALMPEPVRIAVDPIGQFAAIAGAPITAVHLWFDRPITDLPHATLVGRLSQWVFPHTKKSNNDGEHYYQIVISASHNLAGRSRDAIVEEVSAELTAAFPDASRARLLRAQIVTQHDAVFSCSPAVEAIRPSQKTSVRNLFLAGDWTATGWPATMEGAVRSGYLAAEALLAQLGRPERILAADLPQSWVIRGLGLGNWAREY
jgi:squalene-associated FAD-dependent desaturase